MAIEYVGGRDEKRSGSTGSGMSVALTSGLGGGIASGVSPGDLVIASFATGSTSDRTLSISDGTDAYTLIGSELYQNDTKDTNLRVAYKFMADPVDSTVEFGPSGNSGDAAACTIQVFRGVDQSTPLDVATVTATGNGSARPNPGAITPVTTGAFIVAVGGAGHNSGAFGFTSSDLTAFLTDSFDDANDVAIGAGYHAWTSGAFDPARFGFDGLNNSDYSWCAVTLALRPASGSYDLTADAGSYAFTGVDASPEHHREVVAEAGAYSWTGATASLERGFAIDADAGAFTFSGFDAALSTQAERTIVAELGTFSFSGTSASLERGFEVAAVAGSYGFTGAAAALAYSGIRRRAANFYFG